MSTSRTIESERHESSLGWWESARTSAAAPLLPFVHRYTGWWEHTATPLVRREVPGNLIPLIIMFGTPVRIFDIADSQRWDDYDAFTTGVYDQAVLVATSSPSGGVQVDFTVTGARLLLGRPLAELVNRAVHLEDLFGAFASLLREELAEAPSWAERFEILDRVLLARLSRAAPLLPLVGTATARMIRRRGSLSLADLASDAGCSQKHLIATFRREFGLTPKRFCRLLRFERAVARITRGQSDLGTIAHACGYYDQPHFDRDFKEFAGVTPSELMRRRMPGAGFDGR